MSSLSRAQSWPLLSAAAPIEDARQNAAKASQIQARRFLCRHYYPEGGWGWVVAVCAVLVHIVNHGFQMSCSQLIAPAAFKFHVPPLYPAVNDTGKIIKVEGKEFYIHDQSKSNWFEAYQYCRRIGYKLLSISNEEEYLEIVNVIDSIDTLKGYDIWTSGTDLGSESKFYWMSTGDSFEYTNWYADNPNNVNDLQHCVYMYGIGHNHTFDDYACDYNTYFICEK